jgi:hypothetical protein
MAQTWYAINTRDNPKEPWVWTGSTRATRAEAQEVVERLQQLTPEGEYQVEPFQGD